jgi:hypothetical protein
MTTIATIENRVLMYVAAQHKLYLSGQCSRAHPDANSCCTFLAIIEYGWKATSWVLSNGGVGQRHFIFVHVCET